MSFRETDDDVERFGARTALGESTVASEVRPVGLRRTVSGDRGDRVRWGPIWIGAVVAVAMYLLLELVLLAVELLDRDGAATGRLPDGRVWSLVAAAVAFFLGGGIAAVTLVSRETGDGLLHSIGVWALGIAAFVVLAVLGSGFALGTVRYAVERLDGVEQASPTDTAADDFEEAAGMAALAFGVTLVAAGVGGVLGAKLWPRQSRDAIRFGEDEPRPTVSR